MKSTVAALTCAALFSNVAARKFGRDSKYATPEDHFMALTPPSAKSEGNLMLMRQNTHDTPDTWCPGNAAPSTGPFEIGLSDSVQLVKGDDLTALRDALTAQNWEVGHVWQFKAKVTSAFPTTLKFGMAGGGGFLHFEVPAGISGHIVTVQGKIATEADDVNLDYEGTGTDLLSHQVIFEDFCLRHLPCSDFQGCNPSSRYTTNNSAFGDTPEECCMNIYCADSVSCSPASKYEEYENQSVRLGNSVDLCCKPKFCSEVSAELCVGVLDPKQGAGILGSTVSECCLTKMCKDFNGCGDMSDGFKLPSKYENGSMRLGFTKEECCMVTLCSVFNCSGSDLWTSMQDPAQLKGSSYNDCCEPLYCENYTCEDSTKWVKKASPPEQGFSNHRCCEPLHCSKYACSNTSLVMMPAAENRTGSTDKECCEVALCMNYECSDSSKYMHKAKLHDVQDGQAPLIGNSDEECCTPLTCAHFACSDTKWKPKHWTSDNDTMLGSTHEECCDPVLCDDYTCTTDYDNDGNGSKWYKKQDTNSLKWQGSTDEECCYPLYCSQYVTQFPTKWKRKAMNVTLQGSTDPECYDPIMCSVCLCNKSSELKPIPDSALIQGSTIDECCENTTAAAEAEEDMP